MRPFEITVGGEVVHCLMCDSSTERDRIMRAELSAAEQQIAPPPLETETPSAICRQATDNPAPARPRGRPSSALAIVRAARALDLDASMPLAERARRVQKEIARTDVHHSQIPTIRTIERHLAERARRNSRRNSRRKSRRNSPTSIIHSQEDQKC